MQNKNNKDIFIIFIYNKDKIFNIFKRYVLYWV